MTPPLLVLGAALALLAPLAPLPAPAAPDAPAAPVAPVAPIPAVRGHAPSAGGFGAARLREPSIGYRWPLDGTPTVTRRFAPPPERWLPGHRGVDLVPAPMVPGPTVRAAGVGVVAFAGRVAGRPVVSVDHPGGLRTTYEPVEPAVRAGQVVAAGAPIGTLLPGHADCPAAVCLHWGLRRGETYLDPLTLLGRVRVRLLPLR